MLFGKVKIFGSSGFSVANLANAISLKGLGYCTADPPKDGSATIFKAEAQRARSKEFLIKKYSELCELCASAVNIPLQETRKNQIFRGAMHCALPGGK